MLKDISNANCLLYLIIIDCLYRFVLRAVLHSVYICQSSAVNLPPSFNLQNISRRGNITLKNSVMLKIHDNCVWYISVSTTRKFLSFELYIILKLKLHLSRTLIYKYFLLLFSNVSLFSPPTNGWCFSLWLWLFFAIYCIS